MCIGSQRRKDSQGSGLVDQEVSRRCAQDGKENGVSAAPRFVLCFLILLFFHLEILEWAGFAKNQNFVKMIS